MKDAKNNKKQDILGSTAASLTFNAIGVFDPIVSHTTDTHESVVSILKDGIKLKSAERNLFGSAFYVAEEGYSIGEVEGERTLAFRMDRKTKIFDIMHDSHQKYVFMPADKLTPIVLEKGYDAIQYEGSSLKPNRSYSHNFAFLRKTENLTPIGLYPTPPIDGRKNAFSIPTIRSIQVLGAVGTGVAFAQAGKTIYESKTPVTETIHQGSLIGAAFWGGARAGALAIQPCGQLGAAFVPAAPYSVPICLASASVIGGAAAAWGMELGWSVAADIGSSPAQANNNINRERPSCKKESNVLGNNLQRACVAGFKWTNGGGPSNPGSNGTKASVPNQTTAPTPSPAKMQQQYQARAELATSRTLFYSLNPFARNTSAILNTPYFTANLNYASNPFSPYAHSILSPMYNPQQYHSTNGLPSWMNSRWKVADVVRSAVQSEMSRLSPNALMAYYQATARLGLGYSLSYSEFRSIVVSSNLFSYNNFNPGSRLYDVIKFCKEVGGIEFNPSIVKDMLNSEAQVLAENYYLCFPEDKLNLPREMIERIAYELKTYFKHETFPWFSLDFNNQGFMFPAIHPAYKNTLIGVTVAFLDYWMKGYLNGGFFDKEFLQNWHKTQNCNEASLRENLIDLKEYVKKNKEKCKGLNYISLREYMSKEGIKDNVNASTTSYDQSFMVSFRIISIIKSIKLYGNVLVPEYGIRVETDMEMRPDYEKEVNEHLKTHGAYPEEHEKIKAAYIWFTNKIKQEMPEIPLLQQYFRLLGVIVSCCYLYTTLKKMGKEPVVEKKDTWEPLSVPKSFPPLPVRYFRTFDMEITLEDVLQKIQQEGLTQIVDTTVKNLFDKKPLMNEDTLLLNSQALLVVKAVIHNKLTNHLPPGTQYEINDDEAERICNLFSYRILQQIKAVQLNINSIIKETTKPLDAQSRHAIYQLAPTEKIQQMATYLTKRLEYIKERWNQSPQLASNEIFDEVDNELYQAIRENMAEVKNNLTNSINRLLEDLENYLKDGIQDLTAMIDKQLEDDIAQLRMEEADLTNKINEANQQINKQLEDVKKTIEENIGKLKHSKNILESNINQCNAAINALLQQSRELASAAMHYPPGTVNMQMGQINRNCDQINSQRSHFNQQLPLVNQEITRLQEVMIKIEKESTEKINNNKKILADLIKTHLEQIEICKKQLLDQLEKEIANLTTDTSRDIKKIILSIKANHDNIFNKAMKEEALRLVTKIFQNYQNNLTILNSQVNHMTETLIQHPKVSQEVFSKKYTHSGISFTSANIAEQGYHKKVIGGCGVHLPNISAEMMENGEAFVKAIVENDSQPFKFAGVSYAAPIIIPVQEKKAELFNQSIVEPLRKLHELTETGSVAGISSDLLKMVVDESGANFTHYAASVLSGEYFDKIITLALDALLIADQLGHQPIHMAAAAGNADVVASIIARYPDQIEVKDLNGLTPLFHATEKGKLNVIAKLISLNCKVNDVLPNCLSPLIIAIRNNYSEIALLLLSVPTIDINHQLHNAMTPLHLAIEYNLESVALALVNKGASVEIKRHSDGFTPFHCAVNAGNLKVVHAMVQHGAKINSALESGKTSLHIAAEAGQLEIVEYLFSCGADVNAVTNENETALVSAIKNGNQQVAVFLSHHTQINLINKQGQTASLIAQQHAMPNVSDVLIKRKENPALKDNNGYHYSFYLVRNGEYQRFCLLLNNKSIDKNECFDGESLLAIAARFGHFLLVSKMIKEKAVYQTKQSYQLIHYAVKSDELTFLLRWQLSNSRNSTLESGPDKGKTLCYLAARAGSIKCFTFLFKDLTETEIQQQELLLGALESRNLTIVDMILKKLTDVNYSLNKNGDRAVHIAVSLGSRELTELLISRGGDVCLRNYQNQTPFHIAIIQDDVYLLKRLFKLTHSSVKNKTKIWPDDLYGLERIEYSENITRVLNKYRNELPEVRNTLSEMDTNKKSFNVNDNLKLIEDMRKLESFIQQQNFTEAVHLLEKNTILCTKFTTSSGHTLLQLIFANLTNFNTHLDKAVIDPIKKILSLIKSAGVKPANEKGEKNILLVILSSETEEEACDKLTLFQEFFADSVGSLASDHFSSEVTFAQYSLSTNKSEIFDKLDEYTSNDSHPVFHALHEAVSANNFSVTQNLLKKHSADLLDKKKRTPLMLAASKDNVRMMELLLNTGADPDKVDIYGYNALFYALSANAEAAAIFIIPLTRNKNQPNRKNLTPLMLAAGNGMISVVKALATRDRAMQYDDDGHNALHMAAIKGHVNVIEYLVKETKWYVDQIQMPTRPSKQKKCQHFTPLHLAALNGKREAVIKLLELNADPYKKDDNQRTVRECALFSKDQEMLRLIEQFQFYHDRVNQEKLLFATAEFNHIDVLNELILEDNINFAVVDESGCTLIHKAIYFNSEEVAVKLISGRDIPLDVLDHSGNSALHLAAKFNRVKTLTALLKANVDINQHNKEKLTALHIACEEGNLGAVVILINCEADFTLKNPQNLTPAQIAFQKGHVEIVDRLLVAGDKSVSSLSANNQGSPKMKGLLIKHGIYKDKQILTRLEDSCRENLSL